MLVRELRSVARAVTLWIMDVRVYRFFDFHLDPLARELRANGRVLRLPASAFDCLVYLVRERHRAVGRDELIAAIWGRTEVSEKLLGQTMVRIRHALGDGTGDPRYIRTIARFGYHWIAETRALAPDLDGAIPAPAEVDSTLLDHRARTPLPDALARAVGVPITAWRGLWPWHAAAALALLAAIGVFAGLARIPGQRAAMPPHVAARPETLSVVLPAEVHAPDEWKWLRLGLMDLVATRLRRGGMTPLSSESVIGLLKNMPTRNDLSTALPPHGLEIRPNATFDNGHWTVRLNVRGGNEPIDSEARSADLLRSARNATDALLLKLGHSVPDEHDAPPKALEELLQRANAAALGERFQDAADLLDNAPAALREAPDVEVLRALIEIRSGSYAQAQRILRRLLDGRPGALTRSTQARALNALGAVHIRENQAEDAGSYYDAAIALLVGSNEPGVLGYSYMGRGMVASMRGDLVAAVADLGRARVEMDAAGDELGTAAVDLDLGQVQLRERRPSAALITLRAAESRLDRYDAREELVYTRLFESEAQLHLHDAAGALKTTARFWPAETATGNQRLRWHLVLARAGALAANGSLKESEALVERIRSESDPHEDADLRGETGVLAAELAFAREQMPMAAQLAGAAATAALESDEPERYLAVRLVRLRSLLRQNRIDAARAENASLQQWLARADDAWHHAYANFAEALLWQALGKRDEALQRYAAAADQILANGQPQDVIAIVQPYALALVDAGRLDKATDVVAQLGASADTDLDVAWAQTRLYAALGRGSAQQRAHERAVRLAGERQLPDSPVAAPR